MKKGIAKYVVIFWSYISFILLVIIFVLLFAAAKGCAKPPSQQKITDQLSSDAEANLQLVNFLRTPIKFEKQNLTMDDLIVLWVRKNYDKKYESVIETEASKIFNMVYGKNCFYLFISTDLAPHFTSGVSPFGQQQFPERLVIGKGSNLAVASQTAPSAYIPYENSKLVMVSLDLTSYLTLKYQGYSGDSLRLECTK